MPGNLPAFLDGMPGMMMPTNAAVAARRDGKSGFCFNL
jgi:hypothetical protein